MNMFNHAPPLQVKLDNTDGIDNNNNNNNNNSSNNDNNNTPTGLADQISTK